MDERYAIMLHPQVGKVLVEIYTTDNGIDRVVRWDSLKNLTDFGCTFERLIPESKLRERGISLAELGHP